MPPLLLPLAAAFLLSLRLANATSPQTTSERFLDIPSNTSLAEALLTLTHRSHIAGSEADYQNALFVADKFREAGFDEVSIPSYSLFLSYPTSRRSLTAVLPGHPGWAYNASLVEPFIPSDPSSSMDDITPTFHGYSPSGNVRGPLVYANYAHQEDFALLLKRGVLLNGSIIIARYGQNYRGAKVRLAEQHGAVGVLLFSDPFDYNPTGEKPYPDGPGLPLEGVQRGSVVGGAGDPLTPGWPSERVDKGMKAERVDLNDARTALPQIPSLPISAADALPLLEAMEGGRAPPEWVGGLDRHVYKVGRGPVVARLDIEMENRQATVWNVIGVMKGEVEPDRFVILGNHRDAWTFGAVDPNSGTACLLEIARGLGELRKGGREGGRKGWRPRRTLVLASWDAEEHCLGGSVEWGEENALLLQHQAVAYLNVDSAVAGEGGREGGAGGFWASATPSLEGVVREATKMVPAPEEVEVEDEKEEENEQQQQQQQQQQQMKKRKKMKSLYDIWNGELGRLGDDGSDHAVFVQHLGLPATMLGWNKGDYPMYHSTYDDYEWMCRFGDPLFRRHVAVTQVWGLVALALAEEEVLPLAFNRYGEVLEGYVNELRKDLVRGREGREGGREGGRVDLAPMEEGVRRLRKAAEGVEREKEEMTRVLRGEEGKEEEEEGSGIVATARKMLEYPNTTSSSSFFSSSSSSSSPFTTFLALRNLNDRLMRAERGFLDADGLQGPGQEAWRQWLKHLVYSPPNDNEYGSVAFPGVRDAIARAQRLGEEEGGEEGREEEAWREAQHEVWRAGRALDRVAGVLKGGFM